VEVLTEFTVTDLVVLVTLAGALLIGFQQGLLSYLLNTAVVALSFILASVLKGPIGDALNSFWDFGTPEEQELWVYLALLAAGIIGGFIVVSKLFRNTRLPILRQLDEVLGAVAGLFWLALIYTVSLVALDSFFLVASEGAADAAAILGPLYDALNQSAILGWFREWLLPVLAFVAQPFVPDEIDQFLAP
jgi:uncharacterized membrane protein required for colicin V production